MVEIDNNPSTIFATKLPDAKIVFKDAKILVVDDGESNRQLIELLLGRSGADVDYAKNGQIAVELCQQNAYDVILMDMQMPVMDGFTATGKLRKLGCDMPVIAFTANAMHDDELRCRRGRLHGFPRQADQLETTACETCRDDSQQSHLRYRRNDGRPLGCNAAIHRGTAANTRTGCRLRIIDGRRRLPHDRASLRRPTSRKSRIDGGSSPSPLRSQTLQNWLIGSKDPVEPPDFKSSPNRLTNFKNCASKRRRSNQTTTQPKSSTSSRESKSTCRRRTP